VTWHEPYDDPASSLAARLREVQRQIGHALDTTAPGEIRLLSMCAGQGRDVIDVVAAHPRGRDVVARLVELDPENTAYARARARASGLSNVEVVVDDAGVTDAYVGIAPAHVLVVCGVFGNVSTIDIARTISLLPPLSAPGAMVVSTRHRREPDLTGEIRAMFVESGFAPVDLCAPEEYLFTVMTHRLERSPDEPRPGRRLFTFVGDGARPA